MSKQLHFLVLLTGFFLIVFCATTATAQVTFTEVDSGRSYGIIHPGGLMGLGWGDYNDDGYLDLIISGGTNNGALYRNDIGKTTPSDPIRFVQVSGPTLASVGSGDTVFFDPGGIQTNSAVWGDFNGDGHLDLINGTLRVFLNYVKDSSKFAYSQNLLPTELSNGGWGTTVGDFDRDGDLDIAASGGTVQDNGYGPIRIFRNDGNGIFTDAANEVFGGLTVNREAWNPQWVDVDNDGDLDLWMPSIRHGLEEPTLLFFNNNGMLELPVGETGIISMSSIMDSWIDYDNDGNIDLYSIPLAADNDGNPKFYKNDGTGRFTEVAQSLGLDSSSWVAGSDIRSLAWGDYDNDGDQDLLLFLRNAKRPQLWRNDGGTFTEVGAGTGLTTRGDDVRTTTFVDYDNDGWLDVFSMNNGTVLPRLFRNNGGNSNHWIVIKPIDTTNNTAGIGSRVTLYAGGKMQIRETTGGGGNGNNANIWAHFGLGSATTIDSVIIRFSDGRKVKRTSVAADQYYTMGIITSVSRNPEEIPSRYVLSQNYPNPFNPTTTIEFSLPANSNIRLVVVDMLGRVVKEVANGAYAAGSHKVTLNASSLASGVYFYRLEANSFVSTKKLVLMK